jgi:hypothetical protein
MGPDAAGINERLIAAGERLENGIYSWPSIFGSYVVAMLITPSALREAAPTLPGSVKSPGTGVIPALLSLSFDVLLRASADT